jgi:hypothetical protein
MRLSVPGQQNDNINKSASSPSFKETNLDETTLKQYTKTNESSSNNNNKNQLSSGANGHSRTPSPNNSLSQSDRNSLAFSQIQPKPSFLYQTSSEHTPPIQKSMFNFRQTPQIVEMNSEGGEFLVPHRRNSCLLERQISYNLNRRRSSQQKDPLSLSQSSSVFNKSGEGQSSLAQLLYNAGSKQPQKTLDSIYDVISNADCKQCSFYLFGVMLIAFVALHSCLNG